MLKNRTKRMLREGKAVLGSGVGLENSSTMAVMAAAGFDFLMIDTQHTPMGADMLARVIDGVYQGDADIIVRVLWNDTPLINQALDSGADGVIIPLPNTSEEVERAVAAAKYPPAGGRSWGPKKTQKYGGIEAYALAANDETMVLPQIESTQAVDNIDEILEVDGIDGIMVGPNDLALSMGLGTKRVSPEGDKMTAHILDKCKEHGVPWGMFTQTLETAEKWLTRGGQIGIVGNDIGFVTQGAADTVKATKELLARVNG